MLFPVTVKNVAILFDLHCAKGSGMAALLLHHYEY